MLTETLNERVHGTGLLVELDDFGVFRVTFGSKVHLSSPEVASVVAFLDGFLLGRRTGFRKGVMVK